MTAGGDDRRSWWRVGYHRDPLAFTPHDICSWGHRFDDAQRRVRTLYVAESPVTALREVLADFRPNLAALHRFQQAMGADAADELSLGTVTSAWRRQHVLAAADVVLGGDICDLTDPAQRHAVEARHLGLLAAHGLQHLDLHEITTRRRIVTQTIATDLLDRGVAAIRFPSRLDGGACVALFEGRARIALTTPPVPLTDPPVQPLLDATEPWRLRLEPAEDDLAWPDSATAEMIAEEPW